MAKPLFPLMKTADLAEALGVSSQTVSKLTRQGVLHRVRYGIYDGPKSIHAYVKRIERRQASTGLTDAREQVLAERARKMRRENLQAEGELCRAEDVAKTFAAVTAALRDAIQPMAARIADRLAGERDAARVAAIMEADIERTLADAEAGLADVLDDADGQPDPKHAR